MLLIIGMFVIIIIIIISLMMIIITIIIIIIIIIIMFIMIRLQLEAGELRAPPGAAAEPRDPRFQGLGRSCLGLLSVAVSHTTAALMSLRSL